MMKNYVASSDGVRIQYQVTGTGLAALVFVHGWLGNMEWWEHQRIFFENRYTVVQLDLAGHGKSDRSRIQWTAERYADDIVAVVDQLSSPKIILVGHSMSGAFVLEASRRLTNVKGIVLVDTLKDLDKLMTYQQAEQFLFTPYRTDFKSAVENILPQYLFVSSTPVIVRQRLQHEFLQHDGSFAVKVIEPLYTIDIRKVAQETSVPVRSINADFTPTQIDNNRKYFKDYGCVTISGTGHYPMLEQPEQFNNLLDQLIQVFE